MMFESATGWPSSLNPIQPASANSAISDSSLPSDPLVTHPIGSTRTAPSVRAFSSTYSTVARVCMVGSVLGIAHTVVNPPFAAARVPLATVSLYSSPGSRRWQWRSMNPGETTIPAASNTRAPFFEGIDFSMPATFPSLISRSPTRSTPCDGSTILPPLMSIFSTHSLLERLHKIGLT